MLDKEVDAVIERLDSYMKTLTPEMALEILQRAGIIPTVKESLTVQICTCGESDCHECQD